jgi:hypothetical protein
VRRWYTIAARNNTSRIGRVLMGRGGDATDVAISNTFVPNTLQVSRSEPRKLTVVFSRRDSAVEPVCLAFEGGRSAHLPGFFESENVAVPEQNVRPGKRLPDGRGSESAHVQGAARRIRRHDADLGR